MGTDKARAAEVEPAIVEREVVSVPNALVELVKLKLSPAAKDGLNAGRVALGAAIVNAPDAKTGK